MKKLLSMALLIVLMISGYFPAEAKAEENKEKKPIESMEIREDVTTDDLTGSIQGMVDKAIPVIYKGGLQIFDMIFVIGVIGLGFGLIFKQGQWQKFSSGMVKWSFIGSLLIRLIPLFIYTLNVIGINELFDDLLNMFQYTAYYTSVGVVFMAILLRFMHSLIHHPEYLRWSKRLSVFSILFLLLPSMVSFII